MSGKAKPTNGKVVPDVAVVDVHISQGSVTGHRFAVMFSVRIDDGLWFFNRGHDDAQDALSWVSESIKLIGKGIFPRGIGDPTDGCPLRTQDTNQIGFALPTTDTP